MEKALVLAVVLIAVVGLRALRFHTAASVALDLLVEALSWILFW